MATRRIGQILVDLGYLTEDQLWDVLEEQKQSPGEVLGQVAVRLELVTDEQVTEGLAEQWGMPVVNLRETTIPPKVLELVPQTMAETIFGDYTPGSRVNLEVDVIARYLERLLQGEAAAQPGSGEGLSLEALAENGYLKA